MTTSFWTASKSVVDQLILALIFWFADILVFNELDVKLSRVFTRYKDTHEILIYELLISFWNKLSYSLPCLFYHRLALKKEINRDIDSLCTATG